MKTVANFGSLQEAQLLKLNLATVGIEAFIPDEFSAGIVPPLFATKSGVRVQVAEEDEAAAVKMITAAKETNSDDEESETGD